MNRWLKWIMALAVIGCTALPAVAQGVQVCACTEGTPTRLQGALRNMLLSDNLLCELTECEEEDWPDSFWSTREKEDAYRYMVFFHHFKGGDAASVRRSVERLLDVNPRYDPDPDPFFFQNMVEEEKTARRRKKRRNRFIGFGGAALISGMAAYFLSRTTPPDPLPLPLLPGSN